MTAVAVRDEQDHAAAVEALDDEFERGAEIAGPARGERFQLGENGEEMPAALLGRDEVANVAVERYEPGRVLLVRGEVGHRGGEVAGVFQLGEAAGIVGAVAHAAAHIEQADNVHVRLHLEALHVVALGAGEHFPVNRAQLVARRVFAMVHKLDAVAVVRRAVARGIHAFDQQARPQLDVGDGAQHFRVEEPHGWSGRHQWRERGLVDFNGRERLSPGDGYSCHRPIGKSMAAIMMVERQRCGSSCAIVVRVELAGEEKIAPPPACILPNAD